MPNEQKAMIRKLRLQNNSYVSIAGVLGVSVSAVKGYCQRNGLSGKRATAESTPDGLSACLGCGKPITQRDGIKRIKFCSPGCRQAWWNAHAVPSRFFCTGGKPQHLRECTLGHPEAF